MRRVREFGLQVRQVRSAGAPAVRAAALRHEAFDHPVEGDAVVESAVSQRHQPCHMARRQVGAQADGHLGRFARRGFDGHSQMLGRWV